MNQFIQVQTTVERPEQAAAIARMLLERRLAACVQLLGPIQSSYWWQGVIEQTEEWLCLIKSHADAYPAIEAALASAHPYQVPQIVALPIVAGSGPYLEWLRGELRLE